MIFRLNSDNNIQQIPPNMEYYRAVFHGVGLITEHDFLEMLDVHRENF